VSIIYTSAFFSWQIAWKKNEGVNIMDVLCIGVYSLTEEKNLNEPEMDAFKFST